jgi:hypothetical protein
MAVIDPFRFKRVHSLRPLIYCVLLLVMWVLGFINALLYAKDAWAIMPEAVYLA